MLRSPPFVAPGAAGVDRYVLFRNQQTSRSTELRFRSVHPFDLVVQPLGRIGLAEDRSQCLPHLSGTQLNGLEEVSCECFRLIKDQEAELLN